jgi:pimeloyl-ACP methyl ester carboxylesterase
VIKGQVFQEAFVSKLADWMEKESLEMFRLVAVGHSLGGGLAQCFAYSFPSKDAISNVTVSEVFAFDPSPVTGKLSVDIELCQRNAKNFVIYQVFEHGEILAFIRLLLRKFLPIPSIPRVLTYRFNFTKAGVISSHSMPELADALRKMRREPKPKGVTVAERIEQMKLIYDYIKFHIGLYVTTPPILMILAEGLNIQRATPFLAGMFDMVGLYTLAGMHAAWFMGCHVNTKWSSDYLNEFENSAFRPTRAFIHHWIYWAGLTVGMSGLLLSWKLTP